MGQDRQKIDKVLSKDGEVKRSRKMVEERVWHQLQ